MHTLSRLAAVALLPTIGLAQDVGIADAWQEFTKTKFFGKSNDVSSDGPFEPGEEVVKTLK